jgi:hypothetical protein
VRLMEERARSSNGYKGRADLTDPPDTYVAGTVTRSYRLDGLLSTQSFPSSITETLTYDVDKRPVEVRSQSSHLRGTSTSTSPSF